MKFQVLLVASLVVMTLARPEYKATDAPQVPARYAYNYQVDDPPSQNDFSHQEARDGPETKGTYQVQLPDGRLQRVSYTVSVDSGYVADVQFEGEAQYPDAAPKGYA